MKNREWVHKRGMHGGELTSIQKRRGGRGGKKGKKSISSSK